MTLRRVSRIVVLVSAPLGALSCNRGGLPSVFYEEEML
jgi:hypothetical protein